eukprot:6212518-Pleurochrysis_carterae.AAC.12
MEARVLDGLFDSFSCGSTLMSAAANERAPARADRLPYITASRVGPFLPFFLSAVVPRRPRAGVRRRCCLTTR